MYSLYDYGGMILDEGRSQAYADSLARVVTPDSVVVDIGTGTGLLALIAARLGARKVYAIEFGDAMQMGVTVAAQNGLAGRIEFLQGLSTAIELPEKADVIVADLHGVLPAHERSLFSLMDARDRFLAPGGCLIPGRESLWAALVDAPVLHHQIAGVWGRDVFGIDMTAIRTAAVNTWRRARLSGTEIVTTPACWGVLDYAALRSADLRGDIVWEIRERRTAHGIGAWFNWDGAEGDILSNAPAPGPRHIYGQAFFPWPEPLDLSAGDEIHVRLRADAVQSAYVYRWETELRGAGGTKAAFQQSDFFGGPITLGRLRSIARRE